MRKFNSVIKQLGPLGVVRKSAGAAISTYSIELGGGQGTPTEKVSIYAISRIYYFYARYTNVSVGTILYWTLDGVGVDTNDIAYIVDDGSSVVYTTGGGSSFVATSNHVQQLGISITPDGVAEGTETFVINLRTGSLTGPIVASYSQDILDGSATPWAVVEWESYQSDEGYVSNRQLYFNVSGFGYADGTTLYWTQKGSMSAADFVDNVNSGSFTVYMRSGYTSLTKSTWHSLSVNILSDGITEGTETIGIDIRTGSISGPIVGTSYLIDVLDTSVPVGYIFLSASWDGTDVTYRFANPADAYAVMSTFTSGKNFYLYQPEMPQYNQPATIVTYTITQNAYQGGNWPAGNYGVVIPSSFTGFNWNLNATAHSNYLILY